MKEVVQEVRSRNFVSIVRHLIKRQFLLDIFYVILICYEFDSTYLDV
jgi:hypothetical protein